MEYKVGLVLMHTYQCDVLSLSTARDTSFGEIAEPKHENLKIIEWMMSIPLFSEKHSKVETNGEGSQPGSTSPLSPLEFSDSCSSVSPIFSGSVTLTLPTNEDAGSSLSSIETCASKKTSITSGYESDADPGI